MTLFVAVVLAVLTFIFVGYPLFRQRQYASDSAADDVLQELESKRETTYSMLKELEFDHAAGVLTDEDYRDLEDKYKKKAVSILKEIDNAGAVEVETPDRPEEPASSVDDEIERQVRKIRKVGVEAVVREKGPASVEAEAERQVRNIRQGKGRFCTQCGAKVMEGDRFCTDCGAALKHGGRS